MRSIVSQIFTEGFFYREGRNNFKTPDGAVFCRLQGLGRNSRIAQEVFIRNLLDNQAVWIYDEDVGKTQV